MNILLLGKDGQVGWELQRALAPIADITAFNRQEADLEQPGRVREIIRELSPQIVINAAAYTAVDQAESEPERAMRVNADAVAEIADETKKQNGLLIHYSTDYVFDGQKQAPYLETDFTNPLSMYGKTKRAGEMAIKESGCHHLIFRTSWVFALRGRNFVKTILRLAREKEELRIIDDQYGAPTSAELIADITALIIWRFKDCLSNLEQVGGIYHLAAAGETSWHGYATQIVSEALHLGARLKSEPENILPICASEYPLPAPRPANSRLNTKKLSDTFGVTLPDWQLFVQRVISEILLEKQ